MIRTDIEVSELAKVPSRVQDTPNPDVFKVINAIERGCKKILVHGYVQSGKTRNMIGVVQNLSKDSNCVFIVLTGTKKPLNEQTLDRFSNDLIGFSCVTSDLDKIASNILNPVIISMKTSPKLKSIKELICKVDMTKRKVVIIDDESDHASLNNNTRSGKRPTRTYNEICEIVKDQNVIYLSYTATPQGMLLGGAENKLFPDALVCLTPGVGYFGIKDVIKKTGSYYETIPAADIGKEKQAAGDLTGSLQKAIDYFIQKCQELRETKNNTKFNMVINNTSFTIAHSTLEADVKEYIKQKNKTGLIDVKTLNSKISKVAIGDKKENILFEEQAKNQIVIGGEMLSRGLTVPNLLVFYSANISKVNNADTVYQRTRFCGYRDGYQEHIKVYVPEVMMELYKVISSNTEMIISASTKNENVFDKKVWFIADVENKYSEIIPTRKGVMSKTCEEKNNAGSNVIIRYVNERDLSKNIKKICDLLNGHQKDKIGEKKGLYDIYELEPRDLIKLVKNLILEESIVSVTEKYLALFEYFVRTNEYKAGSIFLATNARDEVRERTISEIGKITYIGDTERKVLSTIMSYSSNEVGFAEEKVNLVVFLTHDKVKGKMLEGEKNALNFNFHFTGNHELKSYELPEFRFPQEQVS